MTKQEKVPTLLSEAETDRVAGGDNEGNHFGQIKNGNEGNHFGQIKNGNEGNHFGQLK